MRNKILGERNSLGGGVAREVRSRGKSLKVELSTALKAKKGDQRLRRGEYGKTKTA